VTVLVGLGMLVLLAFVIVRPRRAQPESSTPPASPVASGANPADQLASAMAELQALPPVEPLPLSKIHAALENAGSSDKGYKLPDGKDPPPLPDGAPRAIRIGVVLVRYQGSQLAPLDAPSRDDALARAKVLATLAKSDFAAAVHAGDPGSTADIGAVQRGILEPGTQYVTFSLMVGGVSEILETPRGFWIVKRLK
jgi:hypothetical protein